MNLEHVAVLRQKANTLPMEPGVYLMRDKSGTIIYVGKAKKLKNRVTSYFRGIENHLPKVYRMVENVEDFDYIVCDSEFEALILECSLIKQHDPKYNIMLKDDKGYHYVKITREEYPKVELALQKNDDLHEYIGPFISSLVVKKTVEETNKTFMLPTCHKSFPRDFRKERPCLNYHIHQCMGVCRGNISKETYGEILEEAREFIRSGGTESVEILERKMAEASDNLEFEKAARYRDRIQALKRITDDQKVVRFPHGSVDVIGFVQSDMTMYVSVLILREGKLRDKKDYSFEIMETSEESVMDFLVQYYLELEDLPKEVFLSRESADIALLEEFIREKRKIRVQFSAPQRGENRKLTEMAENNAAQEMARASGRTGREVTALSELGILLGLSGTPDYIEAFDISNFGGSTIVGGMTVFIKGRPEKRLYKKFTIEGLCAPDDYASMEQMLERRLNRYEESKTNGKKDGFEIKPDLWLIDGGPGHVAVAQRVVKSHHLDIPVFGMVKDSHHRTRAIRSETEEVQIASHKLVFNLVTAIQDETHRYTISFSRNRHRNTSFELMLTRIPGVGENRAKALLVYFKTMKALKSATEEEIGKVQGIPKSLAHTIFEALKDEG